MSPRLSIIVETENAEIAGSDALLAAMQPLSGQVAAFARALPHSPRPEILFVLSGDADDAAALRESVLQAVPGLAVNADLEFLYLPGGRYYELKNHGVAAANGDVVALLDSDAVPEETWLPTLIAPFADPAVTAVNGYTSLLYDDFPSRVFALYWIFPLRSHDDRTAAKRPLNANNCAFRKSWLAANPFPDNAGFKVSCSLLSDTMRKQGVVMKRVDAHVGHQPPRGWRFFVWRALVAGRDADRRFRILKSERRHRRTANAIGRAFTAQWRALRRVRLARHVGIAPWQVPAALAIVAAFNGLAFLGQFGSATGLRGDRVERVPPYVERS